MRTIAICLALLIGSSVARAQTDTMPVDIGINVGGVNDYAPESFFVDAMKHSRHWGTVATPWDEAASVDMLGWPAQDAGVVVLCCVEDASGHSLLAGSYALSFQGQAQVAVEVYPGSVSGMSYDAASNTSTATVTLTDDGIGTSLFLGFTNTRRTAAAATNTGVTNVVLKRPQFAPNGQAWWTSPDQIFTSPYLNLVRRYSTLRFMDFTATNNSPVTLWGQRTLPTWATQQSPGGGAWEYVVALANAVHRDIWINIPDQTDDSYVSALATLLHTTLDPSVHVWLEYSNEVWNYSFQQAGRNQAAAEAAVAADPSSPLALGCADYNSCRYEWGERRIGLRDVQIGQIFAGIWGKDATRLRPVFATQLGQTYFVSLVMSMIAPTYGPPAQFLYAIAEAPYFTGDNSLTGQTEQQVLAQSAAALPGLAANAHDFATYAAYWGLRSVTYEGGPGMSGTPSLDAKLAANRSPQIGNQVRQSLRDAFANGVSLYMYYTGVSEYGQYGMWGTTEDVFDHATPKERAIRAVRADGAEPLTAGHGLPAAIDATKPDIGNGGYIVTGSYAYIGTGNSYGYLINVPAAGSYPVSLSVANYYGATTGTLQIDQAPLAGFNIPAGTGPGDWTATMPVRLTLSPGLHVLSVVGSAGPFAVQNFSIAAP